MKILAIIGSPRSKGNSYKVVQRIEGQMKTHGDVEFEYLFLQDASLQACRGCYVCFDRGEHLCPLQDDRAKIEEQIKGADGVVMVSPTYVMNVSGLMKNFIDRFGYVCHRPRFFKPAMVVSTTGGVAVQITLFLMGLTAESWGFEVASKLGVAVDPYTHRLSRAEQDRREAARERKAGKAADKFYAAVSSGLSSPGTIKIAQFLLRKRFFGNGSHARLDHEYWKNNGWLEESTYYFYDTRVGLVKRTAARLIGELFAKFV